MFWERPALKIALPGLLGCLAAVCAVVHAEELSPLEERDDGLHFTRPGQQQGYVDAWLAPLMRVHGDFDITAEFTDLQFKGPKDGMQCVTLGPVFGDAETTHVRVFRGAFFSGGAMVNELCQAETHRKQNGGYRALYHGEARNEALAGRMRVSRRGETVYWLLAENDSSQFRVLHKEKVSNASLVRNGLRLTLHMVINSDVGGEVSIAWKRLSVCAESISERPITNSKEIIAALDRHRSQLRDRIGGKTDGKGDWKGGRWTSGNASPDGTDGFQVVGVGSDQWTSSRVGFLEGVSGDFDLSATFDPIVFDKPAEGQNSTVYLRGMIPADERTSVDVILVREPDGRQTALAEFVTHGRSGLKLRDVGVRNVKSIERLRLVRRGTEMTFLFAEKNPASSRCLPRRKCQEGM